MPRFRRRNRRRFRRRLRRRGRKPPRTTRRWVKRVLNKTRETKILPILGSPFLLNTNETRVFNPTFQIAQGDGSGERIGRKIQNAYCILGFEASYTGDAQILPSVAAQTGYMRMLVLRSRSIKTGSVGVIPPSNPAGMTAGDIFYHALNPVTSQVDKNRWTVLLDRMYKVTLSLPKTLGVPTGPTILRRNIRIPLPKTCTYRDDNLANSTLTQAETYIVWVADYYTSASGGESTFSITPTATIRFKDA